MPGVHRLVLAVELDPNGSDLRHVARCSCGWASEPAATAVLAEAAGEQHATMKDPGRLLRGLLRVAPVNGRRRAQSSRGSGIA